MWKKYFNKHLKRKPREQLVHALAFCTNKDNALDLGAGTLIESKFLIKKGFKNVVAVDNAREVKKFVKNFNNKKLIYKNASFQEYDYPKNTFDLINSQFSLHLYGKRGFSTFIKKIKNSLKPKGIFVSQFLGVKDSWNGDLKSATPKANYVFHTKKQALALLSGLKILEFTEEDEDGINIHGIKKHWHIFYFIAQKK
ncbi:MAG: class I SAM-dependent methyltransferase [Candidatus Paceibacterota bacterium]|jgi:SAM-dependent methyltransferase